MEGNTTQNTWKHTPLSMHMAKTTAKYEVIEKIVKKEKSNLNKFFYTNKTIFGCKQYDWNVATLLLIFRQTPVLQKALVYSLAFFIHKHNIVCHTVTFW